MWIEIILFLGFVGLFLLIWYKVIPELKPPENDTEKVVNELRSIIHNPAKKGHLGEYIVRMSLSKLPKGSVTEKFTHSDMPGIPDFAVKIDELYLIIDSKFTSVDEMKYLVKRGLGIQKYIVPGLTYPFVLMWIPEPAWELLEEPHIKKLIDAGVIPCTTPGMVSTVYLVNYAMKFFNIEDKYKDIRVWFDRMHKLEIKSDNVYSFMDKAQKQFSNGLTNLKKAKIGIENMNYDYDYDEY